MKKLVSIALSLAMVFSLSATAFAAEPNNATASITDKNEIAQLAAEMGLEENPEDIVEIIITDCNSPELTADPIGPEEYIFELLEHNSAKRGELIRSSDYKYPEGTMTVSETLEITFTAESEISAEVISAKVGFTVGRNTTVSDSQKIEVPYGQTRTCNAYVKLDYYRYHVTGDDVWLDDDLGEVTVSKPVGVIFVITR